jgi:hypothetical protein
MSGQLVLNLDQPRVDSGKKEARLTLACSEEMKAFIVHLARLLEKEPGVLLYEWAVAGMKQDIGNLFGPYPHLNKTLRELLK